MDQFGPIYHYCTKTIDVATGQPTCYSIAPAAALLAGLFLAAGVFGMYCTILMARAVWIGIRRERALRKGRPHA